MDEQIALPLAHLPWPRVRRRLMGLIVAADTELAAEQAARARRGRFVRVKHNDDGTSWLLALLTTAEAFRLEETVSWIARSVCDDPGYGGSPDEARADALVCAPSPTFAPRNATLPFTVAFCPLPDLSLLRAACRLLREPRNGRWFLRGVRAARWTCRPGRFDRA